MKSGSILVSLAVALFLTGCATSRSVVTLKTSANQAPATGPAVRLEKIEDVRLFEIAPSSPSTPSLSDDAVTNDAIRVRAIARKRNTYGAALGDVLLPEGASVSMLVRDAMTQSFHEAGYRVLKATDPGYEQATPVQARINKLWAWFSPGFWAITLTSNYDIVISSPLPALQSNGTFSGQVQNSMQLATDEDWAAIVSKSLDDFSGRLKEKLSNR
jgi:hypothetical protein